MNKRQFDERRFICPKCNREITYDSHYWFESCNHTFHLSCLTYHFLYHLFNCPVCEKRLSISEQKFGRNLINRDLQRIHNDPIDLAENSDDSGIYSD